MIHFFLNIFLSSNPRPSWCPRALGIEICSLCRGWLRFRGTAYPQVPAVLSGGQFPLQLVCFPPSPHWQKLRSCAHRGVGRRLIIIYCMIQCFFFWISFIFFQLDKPRQDVLFCHMPGISLTQWLKNCTIKSTWRLKDQLNSKLSPGKIIKTYHLKDTMCFLEEVTYSPSGFSWLERPISHIMSKLLPVVCF